MTTTELEAIDAEIVDDDEEFEDDSIDPLTKTQAKALDKRIRAKSNKVNTGVERVETDITELLELLQEAGDGQIHKGLGLKSWTAWYKDAVQFQPSDRLERKVLASIMSGKGMSQRAIAGALGVSQKTVDRDLDDDDEGESDDSTDDEGGTVTGLDGKTYNKSKAKAEQDDSEPPAPKEQPFSEDFKTEVYQITNDVEALRELVFDDERFVKARKRLMKAKIVDTLREAVERLDEILVAIVGEDEE